MDHLFTGDRVMKLIIHLAPRTLHQEIIQKQLAPAPDRDHRIPPSVPLPCGQGRSKEATGNQCPGLSKK
jgi:hypothetical protein